MRKVQLYCVCYPLCFYSKFLSITCIPKEREALLRFKRSFHDPYHRLASWNGTDCCNWNGVGCNQTTGHVAVLDLRNDYQVLQKNIYDQEPESPSNFELYGKAFCSFFHIDSIGCYIIFLNAKLLKIWLMK